MTEKLVEPPPLELTQEELGELLVIMLEVALESPKNEKLLNNKPTVVER